MVLGGRKCQELLLIDDKKATFVVQLFALDNQQVKTWLIAENVENVSIKNLEDKHTQDMKISF